MISPAALAAVAAAFTALWALSTRLRDVSIVDIVWGPAFALIAATSMFFAPGDAARPQWALLAMVCIWAARLGVYLAWRNHGKPEDARYGAMRARRGASFWWYSLLQVFLLQAGLAWLVSFPLQAALTTSTEGWHALHGLGVTLWAIGLSFEAVGDWQLSRFIADPENAGKVMDRGLWRYTRHPNYFGDFTVWWGYYAFALGCGAPWWTIVGPLLMSTLLLRVSGVTLLESSLRKRRPGYEAYVARTSSFFPWPPKRDR
ncbi:MAG: DUF1295 domain-containing protein [Myxococcota bacterium]